MPHFSWYQKAHVVQSHGIAHIITVMISFLFQMIMKNGDPALNKTDIYGVGALLYRLITYERPWHHDEKLMNVRRKEGGGHHEAKWIIRDLVGKIW